MYLCPDLLDKQYDFEGNQLCYILEENYGIMQGKMVETLKIVHADEEKADLLEVNKGFALLHLEDIVYGADDHVVEYANVFFRGGRHAVLYAAWRLFWNKIEENDDKIPDAGGYFLRSGLSDIFGCFF